MSDKLILTVYGIEEDNPDLCYDLDDPTTPQRFFADVRTNWERGDEQLVALQEMTNDEWDAISKATEEEENA